MAFNSTLREATKLHPAFDTPTTLESLKATPAPAFEPNADAWIASQLAVRERFVRAIEASGYWRDGRGRLRHPNEPKPTTPTPTPIEPEPAPPPMVGIPSAWVESLQALHTELQRQLDTDAAGDVAQLMDELRSADEANARELAQLRAADDATHAVALGAQLSIDAERIEQRAADLRAADERRRLRHAAWLAANGVVGGTGARRW